MRWKEIVRALQMQSREWRVLEGRFGLSERLTLQQLSDELRVTRERVRQIEKRGLSKLKGRVDELAAGLLKIEASLGDEGIAAGSDAVAELRSRVAYLSGGYTTREEVCRLVIAIRALCCVGVSEARWPRLSYVACSLAPGMAEHRRVRERAESVAKEARERNRQWSYREMAVRVLREEGRELHWSEIARRCEAMGRRRSFSASTCFNRIQADRELFVRVGPGTYALAEWGVDRTKTIGDLIARFLEAAGKCLTYGEILHRVSATQEVRDVSIRMTLDLHPRFYRAASGKYGLRAWLAAREMQTLRTPRDGVEAEDSVRRVAVAEARGYNVGRIVARDRRRGQ